ncbi:acyl-CoA dehydrogenase [Streptomyces sp. Li-HN-5-11]|uniref:acyl-CoA dehydrogenase family protein n=1 Tax=Streptomyces sp. Li-HN-5-11 TaxID=3075432 RepID=UPI0028AF8F6E|nr:acyl-CoA dehydrogenase [Streptomyces sp. Li-HN-5-11]WNM31724.1 acyl-CoA dehydrogenase [Streptomyces sp. Li-HN-5-11]
MTTAVLGNLPVQEWASSPRTALGPWGAEPPLPAEVTGLRATLRRFATEVMRPIGQELDRLSAAEVADPKSRLFEFHRRYSELGINMEALGRMGAEERGLLFPILFEELGWGDAGLAISIGARILPHYMAAKMGNRFILETYSEDLLGCWAITEPDHGSDSLDPGQVLQHPLGSYGRPGCVARIDDGHVIINGQKAAWVSNGAIGELCILFCAAEGPDGPDPKRGVCVVVPMDATGVTRGKPLEKLGQRALPQGEIFFDNVRVSTDHLLAGPDDFQRAVYAIHADANVLMGAVFTGVARAAYDLALDYAHERKQGGVPIIRHQDVAKRLFHMLRKTELSSALTRRVAMFNTLEPVPALQAAMLAKVTATEHSLEVASEALQIFGGNGLTHEYPIEKIFRDARTSLIEDGCNHVLALKGGAQLIDESRLA